MSMQQQSKSDTFDTLAQFAEFTSLIIFSYDVDENRFTFLNSAFKQVWGKSRKVAEANPLSLLETVHSEDREYVIKHFHRLINGVNGEDIEFRIQLSDKSVRWLCLNAVINEQEFGGCIIIGSEEDQTAIKEKNGFLRRFATKKESVLESFPTTWLDRLIISKGYLL